MENLRTHRSQNQFSSENPQKLEKMFDKPFLINVSAFDHPSAQIVTPKFYKEPKFFKETGSFVDQDSQIYDR